MFDEGRHICCSAQVDRDVAKCHSEMTALEAEMLANVGDQTTVEKSAQRTLKDVNSTRQKVQEHYVQAVQLQNELAKIKVDLLNTEVGVTRVHSSGQASPLFPVRVLLVHVLSWGPRLTRTVI